MARYIDADSLLEQISKKKCEVGKMRYLDGFNDGLMRVRSIISTAPTADVVPKSEYDAVVSAVDNSTKEFLKLHDVYQNAKAEVERLEGELIVERTRRENAVNAYHDTKSEVDDLKRYIILNEDIAIKCKQKNGEQNEEYWKGKISAFRQIRAYIDAELKKKYTESENG